MGCQNSKDSSDPDSAANTLRKKESFRPLTDEDNERVKKILDYWFVENYDAKMKKKNSSSVNAIGVKVKSSGGIFSGLSNQHD